MNIEKLEELGALPTEAREMMRRQEWMPASLAIRMADAIDALLAERSAVQDAVGNLNRLDEYGDVPLRHRIRRIDAALSDAPVSDAAELVCAWCPSVASGTAQHNDGMGHPSCGEADHGWSFIADAARPAPSVEELADWLERELWVETHSDLCGCRDIDTCDYAQRLRSSSASPEWYVLALQRRGALALSPRAESTPDENGERR